VEAQFMIPPFDVFQIMPDRQPLWMGSAATLEDAKAQVKKSGETQPGEYLILRQKTGHKISMIMTREKDSGT
jgi:hypothetical protein